MTLGWFDLFRDHGGPTLYPEANRTSVIADVQALTVYIVFATLLVAFFVVMPGIRKERYVIFFTSYNISYSKSPRNHGVNILQEEQAFV